MSEQIARQFHDVYERLAPQFGYETREDTKVFDPQSQNGRLMIAVCAEVIGEIERERNRYKSDVAVVTRERDEQIAQMCQAIGYLSTIAEDCEAWLNGESDEPSMEFIKAVRDYARKAVNQ